MYSYGQPIYSKTSGLSTVGRPGGQEGGAKGALLEFKDGTFGAVPPTGGVFAQGDGFKLSVLTLVDVPVFPHDANTS